jgi:exonuclease III
MLEARINTLDGDDYPLVVFVCHWKSKLGGDDATESTRRASARIIVRRIQELVESEPDLPVIVMGDLNENHDEFYRRSGAVLSALLPDDPRAAEVAGQYDNGLQKDFLILSKSKPPVPRYFPPGTVTLYTPWTELEDGSYYYKNAWETIDHFLLSPQLFDKTGWDYATCQVLNEPPFVSAKGLPLAYNPRTGGGLSDHLPLLLFLKMHGED